MEKRLRSLEELLEYNHIDRDTGRRIDDLNKEKKFLMLMKNGGESINMCDVMNIEKEYDQLAESQVENDLLNIYCLEQKLDLMNRFENLNSWKFLNIRARTNFSLGVKKEDFDEKKRHFMLAYYDLEQEIGILRKTFLHRQSLNIALYKIVEVCSSLSHYLSDSITEGNLKLEIVDKGLESVRELRKSRDFEENFRIKYMHSFFYIRKSEIVKEKNTFHEEGINLLKNAFQLAGVNDLDKNICGYAAQAFSEAYKNKTSQEGSEDARIDDLKKEDLENLILAIVCSELSLQFGNSRKENYQAIAREYYDLQFLIEGIYKGQSRTTTLEEINDKIKSVINMTNKDEKKIFGNYNGGLLEIINKTAQLEND